MGTEGRWAGLLAFTTASLLSAGAGAASTPSNEVGLNTHIGPPGFIGAAVAAGVSWVRMDANWFHLEPAQDEYRWTHLDQSVTRATEAGLRVYLTLAYTPAWVPRHGDSDGVSHNDPPNDSTHWVDFVADAVSHYRALGVRHFGLWNESNLTHFFEGSVDEYVDIIVVPGAAAIHSACTDCLVLGPDLAAVGDWDDYMEAMLARAPDVFDIITHHSYNGFEELGTQVWDGDRYFNVLDQQRFPFTRRSLRDLLDDVGYAGEVWMTETGYRATPGDANDEARQARYYELVLREQAKRSWYTKTFFYEVHDCGIDQPECDIDGFGITRATSGSPGSRTYPDDFRTKPALDALYTQLTQNPAFLLPACSDGVDNDGDGATDLADPGCEGEDDPNELDPPPVAADGGAADDGARGGDPRSGGDASQPTAGDAPMAGGDGTTPTTSTLDETGLTSSNSMCTGIATSSSWLFAMMLLWLRRRRHRA